MMRDNNLDQAKIMNEFLHKNILCLYGVCTEKEPILIVTEFMIHGCLLEYLRYGLGKYCKLKTILDFILQVNNEEFLFLEQRLVYVDRL
jgi:serine/threonine protein kinase